MIRNVNSIARPNLMLPAWLLGCILLLLGGCGSGTREIRGELPLVGVEGLTVEGDQVSLLLRLRNVNDRSLQVYDLEASLRVNDQALATVSDSPRIEISARGRETLRLQAPASQEGLDALTLLGPTEEEAATGAVNVAWQLDLELIDERGRGRDIQASGFFHPVPGRPGHFR